MWTLHQPVVMKRELSVKVKVSKKNETGDISGRVYSERWLDSSLILVSALEMRGRSSAMQSKPVGLLWFGHLTRMPTGHLLDQVFQACQTRRTSWGKPRTHWRDYTSWLTWEHLKLCPSSRRWMARWCTKERAFLIPHFSICSGVTGQLTWLSAAVCDLQEQCYVDLPDILLNR